MKTSQLYIGGCSGTTNPNSAKTRVEFGINTTAFGLVVDKVGFFIDNGTGIGNVVNFLKSHDVSVVYGLQTHFHLDHCAGLPMNTLLFKSGAVRRIFAPVLGQNTFAQALDKIFDPTLWPVSPKMFGVSTEIENFSAGEYLEEIRTKTHLASHPGGSIAYRVCLPAGDIVIATDSELSSTESLEKMATFVSGAKLVYLDVQYRDAEYEGLRGIGSDLVCMPRKNWGHSTPSMVRRLLERCATLPGGMPARVVIGHHDPKRDDKDLRLFEQEMQLAFKDLPVNVNFACEGDVYHLS